MPGRSRQANLFFILNNAIRGAIAESLGRPCTWGTYCLELYGWLEDFANRVERLRSADEKACNQYLNDLSYNALVKLSKKDDGVSLLDTSSPYLLEFRGGKKVLYRPLNQPSVRRKAAEHLKRWYGDRFSALAPENCLDLVRPGVEALRSGGMELPDACAIFERWQGEAERGERDPYDLWAALLIYAQTELLPVEGGPALRTGGTANVHMASKGEIESRFSLEERYLNAKRLVVINYAGTSFLAGRMVTTETHSDWDIFFLNLSRGGTEVRIVLTDPDSHAAEDAARYKMRPRTLMEDCPLDRIIGRNIHTLRDLVWRYPECDLRCFLTEVALPCAYLKAEFDDPDRDNLKVDLYLPSFTEYGPAVEVRPGRREQTVLDESQCDNRLRQSFLIFRKEQPELYQSFSDNMEQILAHSRELEL